MTEPFSLVLLGLRVRGLASAAAVAEVAGLAVSVVVGHLEHCRRNDWATFRDGRLAGWALTPLGRVEGERRLAEELDALGARSRVEADYGRFLALNATLLQVCAFGSYERANGRMITATRPTTLRCCGASLRSTTAHCRWSGISATACRGCSPTLGGSRRLWPMLWPVTSTGSRGFDPIATTWFGSNCTKTYWPRWAGLDQRKVFEGTMSGEQHRKSVDRVLALP